MHLTVGQESNKVEGRTASETGTSPERRHPFPFTQNIDQIVLETDNRIISSGSGILLEKSPVGMTVRKRKKGSLTNLGEPIERKVIRFPSQNIGKRKNLVDVRLCQGEHHCRGNLFFTKKIQKCHHPAEVAFPPDIVIVLLQPFQADLKIIRHADIDHTLQFLG